jgi:hypothetical protein
MLVIREGSVFYLTMDPTTGEMGLTDQLVGAAQFHPSAELTGSKVRQRIEYRAKQQRLLHSNEKLLMKPEESIFIKGNTGKPYGAGPEGLSNAATDQHKVLGIQGEVLRAVPAATRKTEENT